VPRNSLLTKLDRLVVIHASQGVRLPLWSGCDPNLLFRDASMGFDHLRPVYRRRHLGGFARTQDINAELAHYPEGAGFKLFLVGICSRRRPGGRGNSRRSGGRLQRRRR
jgi:hypothetical protein